MAITGSGTQADPFVVHSYSEFISLSGHGPVADSACYIQFFENENPNQTIDCNDYGSEFRWGSFSGTTGYGGTNYIYINLNRCTIKNFLIDAGVTMFSSPGAAGQLVISNGAIRNVFMGSATSKICGDYVEFHEVSISANVAGSTVISFDGADNLIIDNCAMYLFASTLNASLVKRARISDTDIELYIANQNEKNIFGGDTNNNSTWTSLTDCRIQGKIGGTPMNWDTSRAIVFGSSSGSNSGHYGKITKLTNCVVDVDLTDSFYNYMGARYEIYHAQNTGDLNTNVFCNSHYPSLGESKAYSYPSDWNYISHSLMRNGAYLNNQGFTVVEVVEG